MGKKKHAKREAAARTELLVAKVATEQRWAYARWVDHVPFPTMAADSMRPVEEGGLGYYLAAGVLRTLVASYREEQGDILGTRDEQRERDAITLDRLEANAARAVARAAELGALDVHATALILKVQERRAKLLGTDSPTEVAASVTVRDGVAEELNAMLERAGKKPLKVKP
jgi:hypothetical protein